MRTPICWATDVERWLGKARGHPAAGIASVGRRLRPGTEVHRETGTDRLADLVSKDPIFEVCFSHPVVLAAVAHVLGEFRLSSLNSRAARPGQGHQPLHADWGGDPG